MKIHPHLILPSQNTTLLQPHFSSPPPSMLTSPGSIYAGVDEGGRLSHSPNQLNAHACSHGSCSASFPTFELLEKHEIINHSSGATSVVCTTRLKILFYRFQPSFSLSLALSCVASLSLAGCSSFPSLSLAFSHNSRACLCSFFPFSNLLLFLFLPSHIMYKFCALSLEFYFFSISFSVSCSRKSSLLGKYLIFVLLYEKNI